jgi:hypothetical protein
LPVLKPSRKRLEARKQGQHRTCGPSAGIPSDRDRPMRGRSAISPALPPLRDEAPPRGRSMVLATGSRQGPDCVFCRQPNQRVTVGRADARLTGVTGGVPATARPKATCTQNSLPARPEPPRPCRWTRRPCWFNALHAACADDHAQRWLCINIRAWPLPARPWQGSPTVRGVLDNHDEPPFWRRSHSVADVIWLVPNR